jgi:signal transduction histidine kinase
MNPRLQPTLALTTLLLASCFSLPAQTLGALTNVAQVRALATAQAKQALPVRLRGVVISRADPHERAAIFSDDTAAIYLLADRNLFAPHQSGDQLEITGVSDPGEFAPIVKVTNVRSLGRAPLPAPRPVTYQEIITGSLDAQWVELTGVVRRYLPPETNSTIWRILLAAHGGVVPIRSSAPLNPLVKEDAEVRVLAVCLYQFNQRRQVLSPVLQALDHVPFEVLKPAPENPFAAPVQAADSLLQFSAENPKGHRLHVRGVVTHAEPGSLIWIRDDTTGLRIVTQDVAPLQPGDEISVLGFPAYGEFSPMLEDAIFRKTGVTRPAAPILLSTPVQVFAHEDDLIALEAQLTDIQPVLEGLAFTFQRDDTVFKGLLKLPPNEPRRAEWLPESWVKVTGICAITHDEVRPLTGIWQPQSFQLLLRTPADLLVLQSPPWWNPKRITYLLVATLALLLCVAALLIWRARHRLKEQAQRRAMAEAEFSAILSERNRVAREIHDTLAQGLAATSVHLRLAKKLANSDPAALQHHLEVSQELVRDSLEEARNSIWNMRSQVLETGDLASALQGILKQMADGAELKTFFEVKGRARRLAPVLENNLLRVGQEAITNAFKHAQAGEVRVTLEFGERHFQLQVQDNGRGFDPQKPAQRNGSFGLVGLQERATELQGELHIRSAPGQGTEVKLRVPLTSEGKN